MTPSTTWLCKALAAAAAATWQASRLTRTLPGMCLPPPPSPRKVCRQRLQGCDAVSTVSTHNAAPSGVPSAFEMTTTDCFCEHATAVVPSQPSVAAHTACRTLIAAAGAPTKQNTHRSKVYRKLLHTAQKCQQQTVAAAHTGCTDNKCVTRALSTRLICHRR